MTSSAKIPKENLSEKLFNQIPQARIRETSTISNSQPLEQHCDTECFQVDGQSHPSWYRTLRRPMWAWQGVDPVVVEETLARIATSEHQRSNPLLLDTVKGFIPGNWTFEWSQLGGKESLAGQQMLDQGDKKHGIDALWRSVCYYSIASYPHLKRDDLAEQAQVLANTNYKLLGAQLPVPLKEIEIPFRGKTISGYLHLPTTEHIVPLVIVSGSIESLQVDFFRFYKDYLAPAKIAMLTLDIPGIGYSSNWPLVQDTSRLHQAALEHMRHVPWVDDSRIAMVGFRIAGNVAARLAFLEPFKLKAAVSIGGGIDSFFTHPELFEQAPQMLLDSIANRMGQDAADHHLLQTKCTAFSLKRQGLMGRNKTTVPLLSIGHRKDFICPEQDIQSLSRASQGGKALVFDKLPMFYLYDKALSETVEWLKLYLMPE
ncbi:esterase FrsA [Dongshaea marina]|uniref:esterase FrsA n=1 Tax=Dongshaea marina TaxID=2047966 RepID=UPI000D3E7BA8|nr:esterase FrsA [Dongshaea marina]